MSTGTSRVSRALALAGVACLAPAIPAHGQQQVFAYPDRGQTPAQQSQDTADCRSWATQQTGVDPTMPVQAAPPPPAQAPQGGVVRGGARGAAVGAIGGAIAGDAGKGAAIGAATGGVIGGMRRADQQRSMEAQQQAYAQQTQAVNAQRQDTFVRAMTACLTGRGYTVR